MAIPVSVCVVRTRTRSRVTSTAVIIYRTPWWKRMFGVHHLTTFEATTEYDGSWRYRGTGKLLTRTHLAAVLGSTACPVEVRTITM